MISKCAKFYCHYTYSSEVMGKVLLTLLLKIKYTTPDNPNAIGLTFTEKINFRKVGESGFLV